MAKLDRGKLRERMTSKKGRTALLWVVLALVMVMTFQGHVNILNQTSVVNELQQQMDIASLNALNRTIDIEQLHRDEELFGDMTRAEFLDLYEDDIKRAFSTEIFKNIRVDSNPIMGLGIVDTNVDFKRTEEHAVTREHIIFDTVMRVKMKHFGQFETNKEDAVFDIGEGGTTKVYARRDEDGYVDLILHNQTVLQYR